MSKRILLVGGVFGYHVGGRRSGYVEAMYDELITYFGVPYVEYHNGGHYQTLLDLVDSNKKWDCIIWMPDVDNSEQKLLPYLKHRMRGALIIQSKLNNGRYTKQQLLERMDRSEADLLIEFNKPDQLARATLMDRMGTIYSDTFSVCNTVIVLAEFIRHHLNYHEPIKDGVIPQEYDAGAFGKIRRHHIHEGVDIYAEEGTNVYAMESGIVVGYGQFTGIEVGSCWWNSTDYVMIAGASGVINYGEIEFSPFMLFGRRVARGDIIGKVKQVLKKDKGLPMSMLHIELYKHGTMMPVKEWKVGEPKPEQLFDPTKLLVGSGMKFRE